MAYDVDASAVSDFIGVPFSSTSNPTKAYVSNVLIPLVIPEVLGDIEWEVNREKLNNYIPDYLAGYSAGWGVTNGSNATFFIRGVPLADVDGDGTVTISTGSKGDIVLYLNDTSAGTWTIATAATVADIHTGKIVFDTPPAENVEVYADYRYYINGRPLHLREDLKRLFKQAVAYRCAINIWQNPNADIVQIIDAYSVDGINISKGGQAAINMKTMERFDKLYRDVIRKINGMVVDLE